MRFLKHGTAQFRIVCRRKDQRGVPAVTGSKDASFQSNSFMFRERFKTRREFRTDYVDRCLSSEQRLDLPFCDGPAADHDNTLAFEVEIDGVKHQGRP